MSRQLPQKWKNFLWSTLLTVLCLAAFPANPLVLTGVLEVETCTPLFVIGIVVWVFGMVLVLAPFFMFPRKGGVARRKSYVHTTKLVKTGIYAVVRHPQYTGGVYSIFLTSVLWYPHWLFVVLAVVGIPVIYFGCREEDERMIGKFGEEYRVYMAEVPRMNIFAGIYRVFRRRMS
ncbi:MAG: isoprenylcysteine carboxylmethyltransferase family protein [Dehalococcoidales bacterium]|nr:isoprenylcysteine carboxylmethyltransferase family protein [Dehalococcoidales bacterium]